MGNRVGIAMTTRLSIQLRNAHRPNLRAYDGPVSEAVVDHTQIGADTFYDWLEDDAGRICGIELHVSREHPLAAILETKEYVTFGPYPQIRFWGQGSAKGRGLEAFGDLEVGRESDDTWTILVELGSWLSDEDRHFLRERATCP
jgi:hypothetical protein